MGGKENLHIRGLFEVSDEQINARGMKKARRFLRMFLTENCRVIQSLTFRLQISYVIKARAKQKDSHIRRDGNTNERTAWFAFNVPCRCIYKS